MDELGVRAQILEGGEARLLVAGRVELEPVCRPDPAIRLGPELGPRPREREVDVEDDSAQHGSRIAPPTHARPSEAGRVARIAPVPRLRNGCYAEIGVPRFELGTSPTRTERATRLRHTPSAHRVPAPRRKAPFVAPRLRRRDHYTLLVAGRDEIVAYANALARRRALAGVRASRAPGRRDRRGDAPRLRRLELAGAVRARGRRGSRHGARPSRALLAQRAARRRPASERQARGALRSERLASRVPPGSRRAPDARQRGTARRADRREPRRPVRQRRARLHARRALDRRAARHG